MHNDTNVAPTWGMAANTNALGKAMLSAPVTRLYRSVRASTRGVLALAVATARTTAPAPRVDQNMKASAGQPLATASLTRLAVTPSSAPTMRRQTSGAAVVAFEANQ